MIDRLKLRIRLAHLLRNGLKCRQAEWDAEFASKDGSPFDHFKESASVGPCAQTRIYIPHEFNLGFRVAPRI